MSRRVFALPLILFALIVPSSSVAHAGALDVDHVALDANWILETQTPEGILANGIDKTWVVPYFANIGARGLGRAYALTGNATYASAAWQWLGWYQAHMDGRGYVTDYVLSNGRWSSTGSYDSTDSYAATFLAAAREVFAATGDTAKLLSIAGGIRLAAGAIESTTNSDGLTYAKPGWGWRYLMDNAEVFEGWAATADLGGALGDADLAKRARDHLKKMTTAFASYWDSAQAGWDWGTTSYGSRATLDWNQLYPSAVAQAYPVFAGLAGGSRAQQVLQRMDQAEPVWDQPYAQAIVVDQPGQVMYWPDVARGFAHAGLTDRAQRAYESLEGTADAHDRLWPFHPGIAGSLILLASDLGHATVPAGAGTVARTPAVPLSHPAASPMQHDDVVVAAATTGSPSSVSLCHREQSSPIRCVPLVRAGASTYVSRAGDLPRMCAGSGSTYWIVATSGDAIAASAPDSYVYQGDAALNAALCTTLGK